MIYLGFLKDGCKGYHRCISYIVDPVNTCVNVVIVHVH